MRRCVLAAAVAVAALLAGCGLGAGSGVKGVSLRVSDGFGGRTIGSVHVGKTPGDETVMRFLERRFRVQTRYGGGFVQSIDGLAGGGSGGRIDWFYYVNGVEAGKGAAATRLHAGDRVWWDRHDWAASMSIPAVVGSFPEPFRSGVGGKRWPVRVSCLPPGSSACAEVSRRLGAAGIRFGESPQRSPGGFDTLRVLVGSWSQIRTDGAASRLEAGPGSSGVYATFDPSGQRLRALDPAGRTVRTFGRGSGLVAATGDHDHAPTWLVTGTDDAGALAAARALDERTLAGRFALVLAPGATLGVPSA